MTFRPDARDSTRPDERQLADIFDEMRSHVDDLRYGILDRSEPDPAKRKRKSISAQELLRRARASMGKGFPASSSIMGGSGGSSSGSSIVERLVLKDIDAEQHGCVLDDSHAQQVLDGLLVARQRLRDAVQVLADATPGAPGIGAPDCRVCGHPVIYALDRCRWCYDWFRANGSDPVPEIVTARREGRRITTKLVAEAEARIRTRSTKRRKK